MSKFMNLDDALVMSKLSSSIYYTQVKTKNTNWQILAIAGVPFEYRLVCMLMLSYASGGIASEMRTIFSDDTRDMWRAIRYTYADDIESDKDDGDWHLPLSCMQALRKTGIDLNAEHVDLVPIAKIISQALHDEVTPS